MFCTYSIHLKSVPASTWLPSTLALKQGENRGVNREVAKLERKVTPFHPSQKPAPNVSFPHSLEPLLFRVSQRQPPRPGPPPLTLQAPSTFRDNIAPAVGLKHLAFREKNSSFPHWYHHHYTMPSYSPTQGPCLWPWRYIHLLQHHFTYPKPKHVLMQQATHSFAVLHMHNYLCWASKLVSWVWINSQGRVLVTATRVDTELFQHGPMPSSVQSPAAEQSMLSKCRRTSLADNIAKQKITLFPERFGSFSIYFCSTAEMSLSVSCSPDDWPNHSGSQSYPEGRSWIVTGYQKTVMSGCVWLRIFGSWMQVLD